MRDMAEVLHLFPAFLAVIRPMCAGSHGLEREAKIKSTSMQYAALIVWV